MCFVTFFLQNSFIIEAISVLENKTQYGRHLVSALHALLR